MHSIDADGELFTGTCPYCGQAMQRIDSGYDFERGRPYDRYVCEAESSVPGHTPVELQVENRREVL